MNTVVNRILQILMPPLVLFGLMLLAWQKCIDHYRIKPYLLPSPRAVCNALWTDAAMLQRAVVYTGSAALCGFVASLVLGTIIAFAFSQSRMLRSAGYPYFIFLQTVPIVAIAPLIVRWCGNGFQSVVLVAGILSLFPILTNATQGLLAIDPDLFDLFRLNNASRWQILFKLRFPSAVPSLCAGARTSSGLAVVGSIVGEFFVGQSTKHYGLGYLIEATNSNAQLDRLFAAVLTSTLFGISIFALINLVSITILSRWYDGPVEQRQ
ncbi:MAG: ABC transporter permease [Planctomycetes bacterium]|nr:ABC transporter permease [Planctomycetota bacterium]